MKRAFGKEHIERDPSSLVTVGTFDGVHLGHQAILRYLIERARQQGGRSVVLSFDPHPREVLTGQPVPLLTTIDERADLLETFGLDRFVVLPFTKQFAALPPEQFVTEYLVERIGLQEIVIGYDHGFGRGRQGGRKLLEALGQKRGFTVDVIPPRVVEDSVVSSSRIRECLAEKGDVASAARMLGYDYALTGQVIAGDGRGREIGFPTANLAIEHERKVVPRRGVYAVRVHLEGYTSPRGGMMNIGLRPTFGGTTEHLEVHLFNFVDTIYGRRLRVEFVERMRDERKFNSIDELVGQLSEDRQRCKRALEDVS